MTIVGPIAVPGKPALGGFQSSNLRLAGVIETRYPAVTLLRYPDIIGTMGRKLWLYGTMFPRIALLLLIARGRGSLVHFTPLCRHFLPFELMIAFCAKLRGHVLVVDIRAGQRIHHYRERGPLYRWMFRALLRMADAIGYEGKPYASFIQELVGNDLAEWLPNFVPTGIVRRRERLTDDTGPNLVYVGRLSREKGVEALLTVFKTLKNICPSATLTLIGAWDPGFRKSADPALLSQAGVTVAGSLSEEAVLNHLDVAHFFVFLSHFHGEGHSNALTEAMARGCVPMVTRHGFSEAVVGESGRVVENRDDATAISEQITEIWTKSEWLTLSQATSDKVILHFSDKAVADTIDRLYEKATARI